MERCKEFHLQLEMQWQQMQLQQQQMQQQQNLLMMMLMNMRGGDGNLLAVGCGGQQQMNVCDHSGGGDNGNEGGEVENNDG